MNILGTPKRSMRDSSAPWKAILTIALLFVGISSASAKCINDFNRALPAAQTPAPMTAPTESLANTDAEPEVPARGIVGLWNVTFTSGGQTVDVAFDVWHNDGTEILNDYTDPIEGNVCLGVWIQTGPRSFKLKHPSWAFDTNGNLLGRVVIRETVTLSPDCNSYKGNYTYDVYDTTGAFVTEYTGSIAATRIRVD